MHGCRCYKSLTAFYRTACSMAGLLSFRLQRRGTMTWLCSCSIMAPTHSLPISIRPTRSVTPAREDTRASLAASSEPSDSAIPDAVAMPREATTMAAGLIRRAPAKVTEAARNALFLDSTCCVARHDVAHPAVKQATTAAHRYVPHPMFSRV